MRLKGFVGGAYQLPSVAAECQRCVNLYPEINEARTSPNGEIGYLVKIYGNRPCVTLPQTPVRGEYTTSGGVLFAVGGNHLYEIKVTEEIVDHGALLTSTGPVSIMDNGTQLMIVDGTYGYYYTLGSTVDVAQITDDGFYAGKTVRYLDGYAIVPRNNSQEYHISALNDVTNWDALDFGLASGSPDKLVTVEVFNKQLWLFSTGTLEIHYNSGNASFPFEPVPGGLLQIGCASPYCVQIVGNTLFWLDSSTAGYGIVWKSSGLTPERVSTHAIEKALQSSGDLAGAFAWSYQDGGHAFYCLTIPYTKSTWCYDLATGQWHERVSIDSHNRETVSRIGTHAFAYNKHYVGDASTGDIYCIDHDYQYDGTAPIVWKRSSPHVSDGLKRIFFHSFELDVETGLGVDSGQGSDPVVSLRYSSDRGHSWTPYIPATLGKVGQYRARSRWTRLGYARDRVWEVTGSDPIPVTIMGAEIEASQGTS